ncbi:hypothetical protein WA577_006492 [Blastocystis sp. JDR]
MDSVFDSILNSRGEEERKREEAVPEEESSPKRTRVDEEEEEDIDIDDSILDSISPEEIDKMLKEADKVEVPRLDMSGIKQIMLELEKLINTNQKMRLKYASEPLKFEESEYALHEQLKKCDVFSTEVRVYPTLVKLDFIGTLSYLLSHDNIVISTDVIRLLDDMTDDSTIMEDPTGESVGLIDEVIAKAIPQSLISNLERLYSDSTIHHDGVEATFHVLSHLIEIRPDVMESYWQAQLPLHLLHFLEGEDYDEVMMYASELLFSLCAYKQRVDSFAEHPEWVEQLLVVLSRWRSHDPESLDEAEILENLFNVLCMMIQSSAVLPTLREKELLDLLLIPIRKHKYARAAALKAVDYLLGMKDPQDAEAFIDKKGLKYLFPALLGEKGTGLKKWTPSDKLDFENHVLCIIQSLLGLNMNSVYFKRVMKKFHDDDYAKCDCILEICARFLKTKERFDAMKEQHAFDVTPKEAEEGITAEEKEYEKKIEMGLHVYDTAMAILHILMKDAPCNWHIQRKVYEQGWQLNVEWCVC